MFSVASPFVSSVVQLSMSPDKTGGSYGAIELNLGDRTSDTNIPIGGVAIIKGMVYVVNA
jgi:hypothetical protein